MWDWFKSKTGLPGVGAVTLRAGPKKQVYWLEYLTLMFFLNELVSFEDFLLHEKWCKSKMALPVVCGVCVVALDWLEAKKERNTD